MSVVDEKIFLIGHESCECKFALNEKVCNSKQKPNHDKCQGECKEPYDWRSCKDYYIWNPSRCDCWCNNSEKIDEYLHIKNCSWKKHLFGKLVLAYENEILNATEITLNDKKVTQKKVLAFFIRFHWKS